MPPKSRKRQKRARRPPPSPVAGDPWSQRRKAYDRLFARLGLREAWRRLPARSRESLYDHLPIDWQVRLTPQARRQERARTVAELLRRMHDEPGQGYACRGASVTIRKMVELLLPLAALAVQCPPQWDAERGRPLVEALAELWPVLWHEGEPSSEPLGELSTYLLGELPDDPQLRTIFMKAGCAHLLELADVGEDYLLTGGRKPEREAVET